MPKWRGCDTLPELFQAAVNDWGNNSYLGVRHRHKDGAADAWFEWESYREVELSVTAIARSLRVVLKDAAAPGMRVAILGPPSIEAVKVWQACCHLSAVPTFAPGDGSLTMDQLGKVMAALNVTTVFVHQEQQQALADALSAAAADSAGDNNANAGCSGSEFAAVAGAGVPQLVVVWGAGGIRRTEPAADVAQRLTALGVGSVGFETFKRSHFNDEPNAAFADTMLPAASDIAAVVVTAPTAAASPAADAAAGAAAGGSAASSCALGEAAAGLRSAGLWAEWFTHSELVEAAVEMLRQRFPGLEGTLQPYAPGESDGHDWAGRPHITTSCITGSSLASKDKLTRLVAATAAAGRVACDEVTEGATADGTSLLVDL